MVGYPKDIAERVVLFFGLDASRIIYDFERGNSGKGSSLEFMRKDAKEAEERIVIISADPSEIFTWRTRVTTRTNYTSGG